MSSSHSTHVPLFDLITNKLAHHHSSSHSSSAPLIWLFDNTAFRSSTSNTGWSSEFVAAYFRDHTGVDLDAAAGEVLDKLGIARGGQEEERVRRRLVPLVLDVEKGKSVDVKVGDEIVGLGPSNDNGISSELKELGGGDEKAMEGKKVVGRAVGDDGTGVHMETMFEGEEGWGVISDIDDTIKITFTPLETGVLYSTFVSDPTPIAEQPQLYQLLKNLLHPSFFYLSASPYNLYPFLHTFLRKHYPWGTLILKDSSWRDLRGFVDSLEVGTEEYKIDRMKKIHTWFPKRKFILIGDSTIFDPESYATIYRTFLDQETGKSWVRKIWIKKVTGIHRDMEKRNSEERFSKAFEGVPENVWRVFESPEELTDEIEKLGMESE